MLALMEQGYDLAGCLMNIIGQAHTPHSEAMKTLSSYLDQCQNKDEVISRIICKLIPAMK